MLDKNHKTLQKQKSCLEMLILKYQLRSKTKIIITVIINRKLTILENT